MTCLCGSFYIGKTIRALWRRINKHITITCPIYASGYWNKFFRIPEAETGIEPSYNRNADGFMDS